MKSFKSFIAPRKKSGVTPSPVHFKDRANRNFKEEWTPRPLTDYQKWLGELPNKHLGAGPHPVSNKLAESNNYTPEEESAIEAYTAHHDSEDPDDDVPDKKDWHSYQINNALINNKPIPSHLKDTEAGLESAIKNNPIRHNVHVFSGVSFNPMDHVDENGRMQSPAYMSTTHDKYIAAEYAEPLLGQPVSHIMEIHLNAGDPATHVEHVTLKPDEHETIINKGVTLRHLKTETFNDGPGYRVHVHHFAIER